MNFADLKVEKFTPETLADAKADWLGRAEALDMPLLDFEKEFDWASTRINYDQPEGNSLAYAIQTQDGVTVALLDVIYTRRAGPALGWLKMMTVKLSPDFAPSEVDADPSKIDALKLIYMRAIAGTVELTGDHRAKVVKLYGRDNTLLTLLVSMKDYLKENLGGGAAKFDVQMQGRWLVISSI